MDSVRYGTKKATPPLSRISVLLLEWTRTRTRPLIVGEIHTLELAVGETLSNCCGLTAQLVVRKVELLQC